MFKGDIIDRTGEINYNKFGSKMIISEYRGALDIDVYFLDYNWVFKHAAYSSFKSGKIKCPYEPRYYGVGYLGEGKYRTWENGKKIYLGTYKTKEEAFRVYKEYKEKVIKEVIDSYKGRIPEPHYSRLREAMYNYKVEIDD